MVVTCWQGMWRYRSRYALGAAFSFMATLWSSFGVACTAADRYVEDSACGPAEVIPGKRVTYSLRVVFGDAAVDAVGDAVGFALGLFGLGYEGSPAGVVSALCGARAGPVWVPVWMCRAVSGDARAASVGARTGRFRRHRASAPRACVRWWLVDLDVNVGHVIEVSDVIEIGQVAEVQAVKDVN
jgi:hypothetical protein